jgi:hypothetical protein
MMFLSKDIIISGYYKPSLKEESTLEKEVSVEFVDLQFVQDLLGSRSSVLVVVE